MSSICFTRSRHGLVVDIGSLTIHLAVHTVALSHDNRMFSSSIKATGASIITFRMSTIWLPSLIDHVILLTPDDLRLDIKGGNPSSRSFSALELCRAHNL